MSQATSIEWTDATWNPVRGCSRVSPGCENCYAERIASRFHDGAFAGFADRRGWTRRVNLVPERLADPLHWKKPRRVFVNSMSDLFHEGLSNEDIAEVFGVMMKAFWHTFQILTKRPMRMREWMRWGSENRPLLYKQAQRWPWPGHAMDAINRGAHDGSDWPLKNVWLGVSVEDQCRADERIPLLMGTPAAVRFLSCEPLLGPLDLGIAFSPELPEFMRSTPDWVIVGGESGPGARPCDIGWVASIVEQCQRAKVPCFVKQLGARPTEFGGRHLPLWGRNEKGNDPAKWPKGLRVQEFPGVVRV